MTALATTRLRSVGNSTGVTLSRRVLDEAGIKSGDAVQVRAEPGRIEITLADERARLFDEASAWFVGRYGRMLTALAR
jgi:antitoxin component of MazEF toxin-antitoxin module